MDWKQSGSHIGVGRFRIFGGPRLRILCVCVGGGGLLAGWKSTEEPPPPPTPFSQIVTVLILKSDNIAKSRIELKGKFLPIPSNTKNVHNHFTHQLRTFMIFFLLFPIEIEESVAGLLGLGGGGGGGAKGMSPPSKRPPPPSSYAYES